MKGLVVYASGKAYDALRGTDQQVADRLSELVDVLYVDSPVSVLRRRGGGGLRQVGRSMWRLTPAAPPGAYRPGMHHITAALSRRAIRRATRRLGREISAIVVSGTIDVIGAAPGALSLRYITDDLTAGAELLRMNAAQLAAAERRLVAAADVIMVVSPGLVEHVKEYGRDAVLLPNGCDVAAGAAVDDAAWPDDLPGDLAETPVAGFVGHLNGRLDVGLLDAVAAAGHPLVLVGPCVAGAEPDGFAALISRSNVHWVGRKSYEELASYLRVIDVGLTPYTNSAFNRASFPLKTLEYLAAGRGVVSTDLPATHWLDAGDLIGVANGPEEFAACVGKLLALPRTAELADRRRAFAAEHDWSKRVRMLAGLLGIDENLEEREVPRR